MKKLIFVLVPLLLLSCGNKPTSTSESSTDVDSTKSSVSTSETSTSTSTPDKFKLKHPSTYSLVKSKNGQTFDECSIEFTSIVNCLVRWKIEETDYVSHLIYTIELSKNVMYNLSWDQVSFTEALEEGDSKAPRFLFDCEYRYFSSDYSGMGFEDSDSTCSEDESGNHIVIARAAYAFQLVE